MKLAKWLTLLAGQSLSSKLGLSLSDRMAKDVSLEEEVSECAALSNDSLPVPNIVHYIWFGCKRDFLPYHYLSVLSSLSVQNACKVFFHTDCEPPEDNELFSHLKEHENFRIVPKEAPTQIFNRPVERLEHQADVARIELLMRYGGIYLDDTQIVTRSMDPLRKLSCTLPYEKKGTLMNGVIVSEPNAPFLKKWFFLGYNDFEDHRWAWNSCRKPYFLWEKYPNLLHVEPKTFLPSWDKWEELFFDNHYPWRENENYAVHIYHKKYRRNHSLEEIVGMNNTLGELARHTATAYNAWPGRSKYLPHFERKEDIIPSQIL